MPLLFILFTILVIQSLRLPGAVQGLNAFFTPNWSAMMDYKVWLAAYGHTFFSLSVGFGIMVTYASYLKPKQFNWFWFNRWFCKCINRDF